MRRISAHLMNWIWIWILKLVLPRITDSPRKTYCVNHVSICKLLMAVRAQIGHVYLIKFTQAAWLLTTDGKVWMKRIWLNTVGVPMLMRQIFFTQGIQRKFWKRMEFIKNDVLLWQFMLCKNINQYNNGLCNSSSDYKGAEIWIGKLMRGRINTSAH